jgi:methionyl-tRNA formyltransferase
MTDNVPTMLTDDPNDAKVVQFLRDVGPRIVIARCKWLLRKDVYRAPELGTFVLHPGICPQYRNAHGCFWALANRDLANVGLTLLQIDAGIDTGPIYGFFRYSFDELTESHIRIQQRVLLENLDAIRACLLDIAAGRALPIEVSGSGSRNWGQPWLSAYLRARHDAKRRLR